jgi:hypothetical protein
LQGDRQNGCSGRACQAMNGDVGRPARQADEPAISQVGP